MCGRRPPKNRHRTCHFGHRSGERSRLEGWGPRRCRTRQEPGTLRFTGGPTRHARERARRKRALGLLVRLRRCGELPAPPGVPLHWKVAGKNAPAPGSNASRAVSHKKRALRPSPSTHSRSRPGAEVEARDRAVQGLASDRRDRLGQGLGRDQVLVALQSLRRPGNPRSGKRQPDAVLDQSSPRSLRRPLTRLTISRASPSRISP